MPRKTRQRKAQELLEMLRFGPNFTPGFQKPREAYSSFLNQHILPRLMELIPEVCKAVNEEQLHQDSERLRLDQEAHALQSEANPPFTKR